MDRLELKILPLFVMVFVALLMWGAHFLAPVFPIPMSIRLTLALLLTVLALSLVLAGGYSFRKAQTTVNPFAPESSSVLVVSGVYRYSRNPMYVGFYLGLVGLAVYLASVLALIISFSFVVYLNRFQILPEEKILFELFGEDYRNYCTKVRRWL